MRKLLNRIAVAVPFILLFGIAIHSFYFSLNFLNLNLLYAQAGAGDDTEDDADLEDDQEEIKEATTPTATNGKPPAIAAESEGANTEIHVKDADISAIIKIFSKKTKRNYILDERVKGKVSIFLPTKVSDNEATRILDAILALKGFTTVPIGGNIFKVLPSKEAKKTTIPTIVGDGAEDPTATVVTRLVRLNYVGAQDLQNLLGQLVSTDGLITAYSRSNSLVIIDYADNIKRIVDIIESIDIPSSDSDVTVVPIENADASDIAATLKDILSDNSNGGDDPTAASSSRAVDIIRNRLREAAAVRNEGPPSGDSSNVGFSVQDKAPKIIPDTRTNSIILVANEAETTRLRALINKLDSPVNLSSSRFYVYRCQHASAEELSDVLSGLTGSVGSSSSRSSSTDTETGSLGGLNSQSRSARSSQRSQDRLSSQRRTPGQPRSSTDSSGGGTVNFGEDIAITADPATNSLIIAASKTDFEKITELLKELDIKRRQVLVEATLLEVAIVDTMQLGAEYVTSAGGADGGIMATQNLSNLTNLFSNPAALSNFSIAAASSGTVTLPGGITIPSQAALVTAAKTSSNVNVLSAPNILTTDNEEAEIIVGQNVPFVSSTSTSQENLNNTFNQVDRQDVGITLRLTPQISSGDFVTLKIFTEVSNVVDSSADSPLGPTTTLRTSQTTVITKSGQMVAIGGLMSDDSNETETGVPFLKDIPLFGQLFRANSKSKRQTNLLIFITPKIIKDQFDARDETLQFRDHMEQKIQDSESFPNREEILKSDRLNNVAETSRYHGTQPGTIKGSSEHTQGSTVLGRDLNLGNNQKMGGYSSKDIQQEKDNDKIVLRVSPPLPKIPSLPTIVTAPASVADRSATYVLLKGITPPTPEISDKLPFDYNATGQVGVIMPTDSSVSVSNFFMSGSHYGYRVADQVIEFEALGIYSSPEEAHTKNPEGQYTWRVLSAHEIMNLGVGPWVRR